MSGSAARNNRLELVSFSPCTTVELEQRKLDRLRELQATIEALRGERETTDPLLAWVLARQQSRDP